MAKGDKYKCDECGLVLVVEDECGCTTCDVVCCDKPMKKVKKAPAKAPAKVVPKKK
ncbi:MAG: hypothetical protein ABSF36_01180 [Candidatus Methanomethylicaceae archaeon]